MPAVNQCSERRGRGPVRPAVWAPEATEVAAEVDGARWPMRPRGDGWWEVALDLAAGARYGFSIDGRPVRPDPRSPAQPDGVHGLSMAVDHASFEWSDVGWPGITLPDAVLYELHIGTFTPGGTFDAAIEHLDALVDLGVTAVELLPVNSFPGRHGWGYDGVALFAPHEPYGGPGGLKRFVDACHALGLGVIIDVVYNHLGPSGNYLAEFGPYFTDRYATPWGMAVNLDGPDSDEVRAFITDNALMWLRDYHADGLRLDAVHAIFDMSATHILEEITTRVDELSARLGRRCVVIAESDLNDPRVVTPRELGGHGCDAQWSDDFHHAVHAVLTGERDGYYADFGSLDQVATAMTRGFVYAGEHSRHRRRRHGRPPQGVPGSAFLGYVQNHDQVGNRARGERLAHVAGVDRAKLAAALVLVSPFVPMLFQGEEWAASCPFQYFTDHDDPALADAVRRGRREEFAAFGWDPDDVPDPQDPHTHRRSILHWEEREHGAHADVLAWHRRLIGLRRLHPELRDGRMDAVEIDVDGDRRTLVVRRGPVTVCANLGPEPAVFDITGRPHADLLASADGWAIDGADLTVPPDAAIVLAPHRAP